MTQPSDRPQLKPWLRCAFGSGWVACEYGRRATVLEGQAADDLLPSLLPLLDGTRSLAEIGAFLGPELASRAEEALRVLDRADLLLSELPLPAGLPSGQREAIHFLADRSPRATLAALAAARIVVVGGSRVARVFADVTRDLVGSLELSGWDAPAHGSLTVVAPAPRELDRLAAWNALALEESRPWLLALPWNGLYATIGPLFVPGETCCYHCFQLRSRSNLEYVREFPHLEAAPAPFPEPPMVAHAVGGMLAVAGCRWLVQPQQSPPGAMAALTFAALPDLTTHTVYRVPRCQACGDARPRPAPWFEAGPDER